MSSINCKKCGLPVSSVTNECLTGGQCLYDIPAAPQIQSPIHYALGDDYKEHARKMAEATYRKQRPLITGVLDYFPDALLDVAYCSFIGNEQHNPGTPLHWDRSKSQDEADALGRHLRERGKFDTDGVRHSAKVAWRALALLQKEIEGEK